MEARGLKNEARYLESAHILKLSLLLVLYFPYDQVCLPVGRSDGWSVGLSLFPYTSMLQASVFIVRGCNYYFSWNKFVGVQCYSKFFL